MSNFLSVLKVLFVPALISLVLYTLTTFLIIPLYKRHRARYSQYLPLHGSLDSLSRRTYSLRQRVSDALTALILPSHRSDAYARTFMSGDHAEDEDLFSDNEGESMVGFDVDERRRAALERSDGLSEGYEGSRRLSRDLEEGFKDDSEDEEDERPA